MQTPFKITFERKLPKRLFYRIFKFGVSRFWTWTSKINTALKHSFCLNFGTYVSSINIDISFNLILLCDKLLLKDGYEFPLLYKYIHNLHDIAACRCD